MITLFLINLNELVTIRAKILTQYEDYSNAISTGEYLDENDVDRIAVKLRETLTWDTSVSYTHLTLPTKA